MQKTVYTILSFFHFSSFHSSRTDVPPPLTPRSTLPDIKYWVYQCEKKSWQFHNTFFLYGDFMKHSLIHANFFLYKKREKKLKMDFFSFLRRGKNEEENKKGKG